MEEGAIGEGGEKGVGEGVEGRGRMGAVGVGSGGERGGERGRGREDVN